MKAMQLASTRALTVTATMVLIVGLMLSSPSGAFLAFGLAGLLSVMPAIFGTGKIRIVAAVVLLGVIGLAANTYPEFKKEQELYRQRTKSP